MLEKIAAIIEPYSRSHPFKMFGFNADATSDDDVDASTDDKMEQNKKRFFKMTDGIKGKTGLMKAYDKLRRKRKIQCRNDDTVLSPLISEVMFEAIRATRSSNCYTVLCVLASGHVSDLKATCDALIQAETDASLSVVFIGCESNGVEELKNAYEHSKLQSSMNGNRVFCETMLPLLRLRSTGAILTK